MIKVFFFILVLNIQVFARVDQKFENLRYRTYFGKCPSRSGGALTLRLVGLFEKTNSLKKVKEHIIRDQLESKYFLSSYNISFDPAKNLMKFYYDCPRPLMKVQVYRKDGSESYSAILVDNGQLFDPTYEVILRSEKKLSFELPFLALPIEKIESYPQKEITKVFSRVNFQDLSKFSEVILNNRDELTLIMNLKRQPTSVFLGADEWGAKMNKLLRAVSFFEKTNKIPSIINFTNSKKFVVKFADKL